MERWGFSCSGRTKEVCEEGGQPPFFCNLASSLSRSSAVCSLGGDSSKASRLRLASVAASLSNRRLLLRRRGHALLFSKTPVAAATPAARHDDSEQQRSIVPSVCGPSPAGSLPPLPRDDKKSVKAAALPPREEALPSRPRFLNREAERPDRERDKSAES